MDTSYRTLVGQPAPDFSLQGFVKGDKKQFNLSDTRGKWTVLFWYPLDFTPLCPTEIEGYGKRLEDFEKLGASVYGISVDSIFSHEAWARADERISGIGYPLLADFKKEVTRTYGFLKEDLGAAYRGTVIIDPEGIVRHVSVNDIMIGRSVDETYRVLAALQAGGACPVNWQPGDPTL